MTRYPWCLALFVGLVAPVGAMDGSPDLSNGISAFEGRRWTEAMNDFLTVLKADPANSQAHAYVTLITREITLERRAAVEQERMRMLNDADQRLQENHQNSDRVDRAIADTVQAGSRSQEERWHAQCEEATMEMQTGHLLSANDIVLRVLAENESDSEAQRLLSDLQSALRKALDSPENLSVSDRYVYEGFYAYGQADYPAAYTAWEKARAVIAQSADSGQVTPAIQALHFEPYEAVAQHHVEERQRAAQLQEAFDHALALYKDGHYSEALDKFRQLAIQEPEYPQLGFYLVQAEAAAEKDRSRRLGEAKRQEVAALMESGMASLEKEKYDAAERAFRRVLSIDPSHTQARSYLAMATTESSRLHDPKAAQMHYEAGLIDYASGKLDEAVREWQVATRMDPQNEKAANALVKVQRELALSSPAS